MAVATTDLNNEFTRFEFLLAEYKATLASWREAIGRLADVERRLHDAATKLGISTDSLHLPLGEALPDESTTAKFVSQLSEREMLVFTLLGQGLSTLEIAQRLDLANSTVETYRERMKRKLNIASSAGLIREAVLWVGRK